MRGIIIGQRNKIEILYPTPVLHLFKSLIETVFPSNFITPREMINLLKPPELRIHTRLNHRRTPDKYYFIITQKVLPLAQIILRIRPVNLYEILRTQNLPVTVMLMQTVPFQHPFDQLIFKG